MSTIADVFTALTTTVTYIFTDFFDKALQTITSNPLLFVPILIGFAGVLIFAAVGLVKRFGVRRG